MQLQHKGLLIVSTILAFEIGSVGFLAHALNSAEEQIDQERRTRDIILHLDQFAVNIQKMSVGYLKQMFVPEDYDLVGSYLAYVNAAKKEVNTLHQLLDDRPDKKAEVDELDGLFSQATKLMERSRNAYLHDYVRGKAMTIYQLGLSEISDDISRKSTALLESLREQQEQQVAKASQARADLKLWLALGLGFNVVLALALFITFILNITKRLATITSNSVKLAIGQPLGEPVSGDDEIAQVDQSFHQMAAELDEARQKEQAVLENAVDLICSIDNKGQFSAVNPASEVILGYTSEELLGRRYIDIVAESYREATRTAVQAAMDRDTRQSIENQLICKNGSLIDALWSVQWSSKLKSLFCVVHDITERKQIDRMKQEFVAMVSHDLRTPLTAVSGALTLIGKGVIDPATEVGQKRITDAHNNVDRLIRLIKDLLDLERMETGKLDLDLQPVQASEMIRTSLLAVEVFAEQKGISLETTSDESTAMADNERVVQVLINLLSNAIKFSPKGEAVKVVSGVDDGWVKFSVIDNGPGIPDKLKEVVFERFKQLDSSGVEQKKQGTGLGLAICKAIVEAHGGTLGVDSEAGQGSTFWFRLPAV